MVIFRASIDTRHFCFDAFADTPDGARLALRRALLVHGEQYKLAHGWWRAGGEDGFEVRRIAMQVGYRDQEPIARA